MDKTLSPLPPVGRITLMPVFLVLLLLVLLNEQSAHCASLNAEAAVPSCNPGEIPLKAHVKEPGCYALAHLHQECNSSRQCIDQDTFCGFYNHHHHHHLPINATLQPFNKGEKTVCICRDGTKEVGGRCVVRHHCSIGHFNRDYHQADCPHASQYCTGYRCFCKAGYTQVEDGCLPEEVEEAVVEKKEKEEEMTSTEEASSDKDNELTEMINLIDSLPPPPPAANPLYTLDPVALVGLFLLALIIGTLLLAFVCYLPLVVFGKIKSRYSRVEEGLV